MAGTSEIEFNIVAKDNATETLRRIRHEARLTGRALRRARLRSLLPWATLLWLNGVVLGYGFALLFR